MRCGGACLIAFAFALVASATCPVIAHADEAPSKEACVEAYKSSQELSRDGALGRARAALLVCARDPCSQVLQKDCLGWLADVEQRMPTLVVSVTDESGHDIVDARVRIDGVEVAARIDGRTFDIDPGEHTIAIEPASGPAIEQVVVAREREKGRVVVFELKKSEPVVPPPTISPLTPLPRNDRAPSSRALPWTFWAVGGVGAVAAGSFAFFGVRGLVQRSDLDSCLPTCATDRIDRAKTNFVIADVSLIVAVVAAGIDTWLWLSRPSPSPER